MAPSTAPRVAAVRAGSQGSGCLLTPRLILTVAHVHAPSSTGDEAPPAEAAVLDGNGWAPCTTVWRSTELDATLLLADRDLTSARLEPLRWGTVDSSAPVAGVHLTGFPAVARDQDQLLDTAQALATLTPGTGQRTGRPALVLQQQPPQPVPGAPSPWSGMSGAPVLYQGRLLGLAVSDRRPEAWAHSQLDLLPVTALLADEGFRSALIEHLDELPRPEGISAEEIADADFERDYAKAIETDYGRIRIFGLRQAGRRGWKLSTSYLSLEMRPPETRLPDQPDGEFTATGPQRADTALRGRRRLLVRGQAGSGKTTLVQWLAIGAVNGTLDKELSEFNHRVPLVLQLRKLHRKGVMQPRPADFLSLDDRMCADRQPADWAHRLLAGGRALLLVDGLDEVPDEQRSEVQAWLEKLLDHYPDTLTLATVRPSAVPPGWLDHLGFDELLLCPMGHRDRRRFIERWHRAALHELLAAQHTDAQAQRWCKEVKQDEADLLRTLDTVPEIAQLTDSPLLCAMICALNRETDGALPRNRMTLYRDALAMLLVKRDEGRRVDGAEQLQASEEEQLALLRRIAHWLVRNNQVEGRRQDAVAQLAKALRDLPALARRTDPEQAYTHLLNRSGLITETSPDTFQFIHRTFQDYLAAMEFREERDFGLLAGHAADEQWSDVIRLTVGHCGRRERAELLTLLLRQSDTAPRRDKAAIRLLTATCLPNAPELDGEVRDAVLRKLRRHLSEYLRHRRFAKLVAVGEDLVPLLRELALSQPDLFEQPLQSITNLLGRIGGEESLALLEFLAGPGRKSFFRENIIREWGNFDIRLFGQRVVSKLDLRGVLVAVELPEQLEELSRCPTLHRIWMNGSPVSTSAHRWPYLAEQVETLGVANAPEFTDLSFLRGWQRLNHLTLIGCPDLDDLTPLSGMNIRSLRFQNGPAEQRVDDLLAIINGIVGLKDLSLTAPHLGYESAPAPFPEVEKLHLHRVPTGYPLDLLPMVFPSLAALSLHTSGTECASIDLSPLANAHRLQVRIVSPGDARPQLIGHDLFPADRVTLGTSYIV